MLLNWGIVTREKLKDWVDWLKRTSTSSDLYDHQNLHLSGFVIRNSLGPNLLARVISLAGASTTGPELFMIAVHQVAFMTAVLIRIICNEIGAMRLDKISGENTVKLRKLNIAKIKQIESSEKAPDDIKTLVAKS